MSGEKKRNGGGGREQEVSEGREMCSMDTVKKADRKPPRSSWAQDGGAKPQRKTVRSAKAGTPHWT